MVFHVLGRRSEIDDLIDRSRAELDVDARNALYREIQAKLVERQSDVFYPTQQKRMAAHECLQGYAELPMESWDYDFLRVWWDCNPE